MSKKWYRFWFVFWLVWSTVEFICATIPSNGLWRLVYGVGAIAAFCWAYESYDKSKAAVK